MTSTTIAVSRMSRPAWLRAVEIITNLKASEEHRYCPRKNCDIALDRWDHCKHGTYVGDWAGPDYMCGYCEDGTSDYHFALWAAMNEQARHVAEIRENVVHAALNAMAGNARATWLPPSEVAEMIPALLALRETSRCRR